MNEHDIKRVLERQRTDANPAAHREALLSALLSLHAKRSSSRFLALRSFIMHSPIMKSLTIPLGAAFLMLAIFFTTGFGVSNVAEAQQLLDRSFTKAFRLSPEMREKLEAHMKTDLKATYEEAKAAKDLKIMTPEEYAKEAEFSISTTPGAGAVNAKWTRAVRVGEGTPVLPEAGHKAFVIKNIANLEEGAIAKGEVKMFSIATSATGTPDVATAGVAVPFTPVEFKKPVKYLSYTDPEGRKVVLGIDDNDTPVMKISTMRSGDIIRGPNGEVGFPAEKVIKLQTDVLAQ